MHEGDDKNVAITEGGAGFQKADATGKQDVEPEFGVMVALCSPRLVTGIPAIPGRTLLEDLFLEVRKYA